MEKHRQGYAFSGISFPISYTFDRVEPQEMIYKLEYTSLIKDQDQYIHFVSEYGWEYVGTFFDFSYFRKPKTESTEEDDIFSDEESKIAHLDKILYSRGIAAMIALAMWFIIIPISDGWTLLHIIPVLLVIIKLIMDYRRIKQKIIE